MSSTTPTTECSFEASELDGAGWSVTRDLDGRCRAHATNRYGLELGWVTAVDERLFLHPGPMSIPISTMEKLINLYRSKGG